MDRYISYANRDRRTNKRMLNRYKKAHLKHEIKGQIPFKTSQICTFLDKIDLLITCLFNSN